MSQSESNWKLSSYLNFWIMSPESIWNDSKLGVKIASQINVFA